MVRMPRLLRRFEERVDGVRVHRAETRDGRGAIAQALVQENFRDGACVRAIGELLLGDECVLLEPVEQLFAVCADDLRLRVVDVAIDESRQHERIGSVFLYRRAGG